MCITKIIATNDKIEFVFSEKLDSTANVACYSPALVTETNIANAIIAPDSCTIDRFCNGRDLIYCRFSITKDGKVLEGKRYVETIAEPLRSFDYPVADTKKG